MIDTITRFFDACQPFGYPLLACSLILITAIFYHILYVGSGRLLRDFQKALSSSLEQENSPEPLLMELCRRASSPLADEVLYVLGNRQEPDLEEQVEARLRLLVDAQRAGMATISVITNIAPMLGILGTAWGLVEIFGVFGSEGAEPGIAMGISTALYTTIFGLAIAVPGIIALTCFERALERRAARINCFFTELLAATKNSH